MTNNPDNSASTEWSWENLKHDLPASFVVFLVALPLCMGVAIASGAPVTAGLVTGIVGGLLVGALAGSPLQVSGPAAGLTVLVYQFLQEHGIESLGPVVLLAGGLQVVAAAMHLGQWFRAVSPAVIQGMLAGIGVLILAGQFHVMIDDQPQPSGWRNLVTIPQAIYKGFTGARLGTVEERATRTEQLHELGLLHLKQAALAEQVHHLVSGEAPPPSRAARKNRGKVQRPVTIAPPGEEGALLQQLAPAQAEVVAELRKYDSLLATDISHQALADSEAALVELQAASGVAAKAAQDQAEASLKALRDSRKSHRWAAILGCVTIGVIVLWQGLFAKRIKFLPAPLLGVGLATLAAVTLHMPVIYVEVPDNLLSETYLPSLAELSALSNPKLLLAGFEIAVIASAETLLCASAVDKLHRGPRTKFDRELGAQGVGNMVCGLLSALPMTGVIVRSSANVNAGARTRLSAVLHGLWILTTVAFCAHLLRLIPTCSLAAVLVYTGYKLINPKAVKDLWKHGRFELLVYFVTLITIVAVDLLTGVLVGIGLAVAKLVYILSHLEIRIEDVPGERRTVLELKGSATFLRLPALAAALERVPLGNELYVNVAQLDHIDHASLDLLHHWEVHHAPLGSKLTLDRESLAARFWHRAPPLDDDEEFLEAPPRQRQVPI